MEWSFTESLTQDPELENSQGQQHAFASRSGVICLTHYTGLNRLIVRWSAKGHERACRSCEAGLYAEKGGSTIECNGSWTTHHLLEP